MYEEERKKTFEFRYQLSELIKAKGNDLYKGYNAVFLSS
jgi:hypothetical protein